MKMKMKDTPAPESVHTDDTDSALFTEITNRWSERNKVSLTILVIESAEEGDGKLATLLADIVQRNHEFPQSFDELATFVDNDGLTDMAHAATCELLDRSLGE